MTKGNDEPASEPRGRRSTARLAAVQVLYEMDLAGATADAALRDHLADRWSSRAGEEGGSRLSPPHRPLLIGLVNGVTERLAELDGMVDGALSRGWTTKRLEVLLRAILRCGAYELLAMGDVPAKVVINEYMDVATAFFSGGEPTLVNGVLDRLAHVTRAEELAGSEENAAPPEEKNDPHHQ